MSADTIVAISEIIQGLLLPFLAGMLAVQAFMMRQMSRWLFELQMQMIELTHLMGVQLVESGEEGERP